MPQNVRTCSCCGRSLPITEFYLNSYPDGRRYPRGDCKGCIREKRIAYRQLPHVIEAERKRRESGYFREWWIRTADERHAYGAAYRAANPDKCQQKVADYNARKAKVFKESVERQVVLERDGGVCGICHEPVDPSSFHVDHIIPMSRGGEHSYANTQVAHPICNWRKNDRMPEAA